MARLKLVTDPNDILRAKNADLSFPLSRTVKELIDQMIFACKKFKGIGLAAPQIGKNLNLAVINLVEYDLPVFPIINPKIVSAPAAKTPMEEGCLSLPGKFGQVARPEKITAEFFNTQGKKIKLPAEGLLAKVLQHEIDHLNGILIMDKWDKSTVHTVSESELEKYREERRKRYKISNLKISPQPPLTPPQADSGHSLPEGEGKG